jgi:hypothetical protein
LITGFEDWRVAASVNQRQAWGRANAAGDVTYRASGEGFSLTSWQLSTSLRPLEQVQIGAQIDGVTTRTSTPEAGEMQIFVAWEVVRNPLPRDFRPKVLLSLGAGLPLGPAPEVAPQVSPETRPATDGHLKLISGAHLFSTWRQLDLQLSLSGVGRRPRQILDPAAGPQEVTRPLSLILDTGAGWAVTSTLRLGLSFGWIRELDQSAAQRWPARLQLSYIADAEKSFSLVYSDETLIGPAVGSELSRSIGLLLTFRSSAEEASPLEP